MKNKIFVTGADGFIGANFVNYLIDKKYNVTALCKYNSYNSKGWLEYIGQKKSKKLKIIFGDICDQNYMRSQTKNIDIIFNLAALIAIPHSYDAPESYLETNTKGTLNCLLAAKENKIDHFFQISTSEVYGSAKYIPIDEDHPLNAQSPYAASKIGADQLTLSFYKSYDLNVTILRPFNNYGKFQSARAIIPTIITQFLNKSKNIKLGSINTKRDFLYVEDTVRGFELAIKKRKKIIGETINFGTGKSVTILNIIKTIQSILKIKKKILFDRKRIRPKKSEVNHLLANNDKAKKLLGWKPKFSEKNQFKLSLKKTINWYKENSNLFDSNKYNL